jgi:Tfp pilus assembly protein PilP
VAKHAAEPKPVLLTTASKPPAAATVASTAGSGEGENTETEQSVTPDSKYNANGRRDPFISPVVAHASGSGCSTGKKCLEIGNINLRGVVHAESGFIAVVSNSLNKAYFLRENDPVFNGYVVKITGDSIVFQETLQDRLGKSFTREVVKKITTPAV